jgi:hypothetical protein
MTSFVFYLLLLLACRPDATANQSADATPKLKSPPDTSVAITASWDPTGTATAHSNISFLSQVYRHDKWMRIKASIHCISNYGFWSFVGDRGGLLYQSPCYDGRYALGKCHIDYLYKNMSGLDYVWSTHGTDKLCGMKRNLSVVPFNRDYMCSLLDGRRILLLGDSITDEFFYSLASTLIQSHSCRSSKEFNNGFHTVFEFGGNISYQLLETAAFGCGRAYIYVVRHDHFLISEFGDEYTATVHAQETLYGAGWHYLLKQLNIDLIIANRGVHYVPNDIVLSELEHTLSYLRQHHGGVSVIYRSSAPGHKNFDEVRYSAPLSSEAEAQLDMFSWDKLKLQNSLIRQLLRNSFNEVLYLDVYPSSVLRHDGHTTEDGLHYCIPGPIDNWVVLFYNLLSLLQNAHKKKP